MNDNAKEGFFINDPALKHISRMELIESYKIENGILLKEFENKLRKTKDSFLKGLFVMVSKRELLELLVFGFFKNNKT